MTKNSHLSAWAGDTVSVASGYELVPIGVDGAETIYQVRAAGQKAVISHQGREIPPGAQEDRDRVFTELSGGVAAGVAKAVSAYQDGMLNGLFSGYCAIDELGAQIRRDLGSHPQCEPTEP
ncbi:hypothetical protein OKW30_001392 [Paraburkholderia sp. Clong3]|uniref:hypothetical protein n=1 Tax=Paraburkholderia sp. Clong3 TaxID=2991061 RepID=UPI003D1D57E3